MLTGPRKASPLQKPRSPKQKTPHYLKTTILVTLFCFKYRLQLRANDVGILGVEYGVMSSRDVNHGQILAEAFPSEIFGFKGSMIFRSE